MFPVYIILRITHLLFWYQVFTCVSVRLSLAASSILSCTLRYFCRSKLFSRQPSWWSVKAVRAFRGFLDFDEHWDMSCDEQPFSESLRAARQQQSHYQALVSLQTEIQTYRNICLIAHQNILYHSFLCDQYHSQNCIFTMEKYKGNFSLLRLLPGGRSIKRS